MSVATLSDLVFHVREVSAGRPDLLTTRHGGRLETVSTTDFLRNVHSLALALEERGVAKGERVAIYSENRPEWHVVDFACQLLGAVTVPIDPHLPGGQVAYLLRNSGCRWVFYSDGAKRDQLLELRQGLTAAPTLVAFEGEAAADAGGTLTRLLGATSERRGKVPLERFRGRVAPDDLASILYTSGTTGDPKGVMLSHRNLVSNFTACAERFPCGPSDTALSFLPLSYAFQRTVDNLCFYRGVRIVYLPAVERVPKALLEVRPTILTSVPRLYERAAAQITTAVAKETAVRRRLFRWAVDVGKRWTAARQSGLVGPFLGGARKLAEVFVYRGVQQRFGGRLRLAISGGAPLPLAVGELMTALGVPIYQGYGLTETSPVLATNAPGELRQGSVGRPLAGVEVRIAEDGEILVRGPGVMLGYWHDEAATAEVKDADGWLRTGDLGHLDADGYLHVTDRKEGPIATASRGAWGSLGD